MNFNFTLIRHSTAIIEIEGKKIVMDPLFSDIEKLPPVPLTKNKLRNPRTGLSFSIDDIIKDIDYLLLTHLHFDHFDKDAIARIPKSTKVLSASFDSNRIKKLGYTNIYSIENDFEIDRFKIRRYPAKHGKGLLNVMMGKGSSYQIDYDGFKIFITGDCILTHSLKQYVTETNPDIIIANGGATSFRFGKPITMSIKDILEISKILKDTKIILIHLDALNHCTESRDFCKEQVKDCPNIVIPDDGETIKINTTHAVTT